MSFLVNRTKVLSSLAVVIAISPLIGRPVNSAPSVAHLDAKLSYKLKTMSDSSPEEGNWSNNDATDRVLTADFELSELLRASANRSVLLTGNFPRAKKAGLTIATSPDGRLRWFSWDIMTTGTGRPHEAVALWGGPGDGSHYLTNGGNSVGWCDKICCLKDKNGTTLYLVICTIAQSSIITGTKLLVYEIKNAKLIPKNVFKTKGGMADYLFCDQPSSSDVEGYFPPNVTVLKGGTVLKIPLTDSNRTFTGKFYKYVFNGTNFVKRKY